MSTRTLIVATTLIGSMILCPGCSETSPRWPVHPLETTKGFVGNKLFQFTISPDDDFMVYFEDKLGTRVVNTLVVHRLADGVQQRLELRRGPEDYIALAVDLAGNRCWTANSRYCMEPARGSLGNFVQTFPRFVLDFTNPADVRLTQHPHGPGIGVTYPDLPRDRNFTCSDCRQDAGEKEFLEQHVPDARDLHYQPTSSAERSLNVGGCNIASHDRTRIYYQKGYRTRKVSLYEYEVAGKTERLLTSLESWISACIRIDDMTLSHDGRYLAFHVNRGCHWTGAPELFVVDVREGKRYFVADNSYYDMHWLAHANRLYFYACAKPGGCDENDHLWYAEPE